MAEYDWILGVGLTFGLPFLLMFITKADMKGYFVFATMISAFVVYGGLLDVWVMILLLVVDVIVVIIDLKSRMRGNIG